MNQAAGETADWPEGKRYALHHAIIAGDTAYGSWRDGGLTLLDVKDRTQPKLISHRNWSPPFGGGRIPRCRCRIAICWWCWMKRCWITRRMARS
jgi:hypothetical protein